LVIPVYFIVALTLYTLIFLLIDEKLQGATLQSLMESSFKRGLFCFMPVLLFYAAASSFSIKIFGMLEDYRNNKDTK
jgi:EamA domain-containing membrane protein RarD